MSTHLKLVTLSVAVVAALSAAYLMGYLPTQIGEPTADIAQVTPDTPVMAQTTQPQASGEQTAPQEPAIDPEDVDPASIDWEGMRARYGKHAQLSDPMLRRAIHLGGFTDLEIAAFNKLAVLPFNPMFGMDCVQRDMGLKNEDMFYEACKAVKQSHDHPYEEWPLDRLVEMAQTDAEAAVFASRKSADVKDKVAYALRATALSEKTGPILEVAAREFGSPYEISGKEMILSEYYVVSRAVLERVAATLGDPRADPELWDTYVDELVASPEQKEQFFQTIEDASRAALDSMIEIQRDVTGSTHVWGLTDA